ncbi:hypothetical protein [Granulibacter bethesdensis]|uniref:hypothetical protein n=1 Tax=Granulibacter bethesdensis TaxID=364410 RepID=UPI0003F1F01B|nr:hypothetical protein [Granulibacter bethesdensis]AHJ67823.1 Transcriptional regulator, TetR family [Granulibacter bethesdensis]
MTYGRDDSAFDHALIAAAFSVMAERGWRGLTVAEAARRAGLPLDQARRRFPDRFAILSVFGRQADEAALARPLPGGEIRDRLLDILMRRIDVLQLHRQGMLALLTAVPFDPVLALFLTRRNRASMGWLLEGAGIPSGGILGGLRIKGLLTVWLWTIRAWSRDETEELGPTLAALDVALERAEQFAALLPSVQPVGSEADEEDAGVHAAPEQRVAVPPDDPPPPA